MTPEEVVEQLAGTCNTEIEDMDTDEVIEIMVDAGYEICPECEWWVEQGELMNEDDVHTSCDNCGNNIQNPDFYCYDCKHIVQEPTINPCNQSYRCDKYGVFLVYYDGVHRTTQCFQTKGKEPTEDEKA